MFINFSAATKTQGRRITVSNLPDFSYAAEGVCGLLAAMHENRSAYIGTPFSLDEIKKALANGAAAHEATKRTLNRATVADMQAIADELHACL